jgi:hypothetical protein
LVSGLRLTRASCCQAPAAAAAAAAAGV